MKTKQEIEAEIDRIFSTTGWQGLTFERFEKIVIELSGVEAPEGYVRISSNIGRLKNIRRM